MVRGGVSAYGDDVSIFGDIELVQKGLGGYEIVTRLTATRLPACGFGRASLFWTPSVGLTVPSAYLEGCWPPAGEELFGDTGNGRSVDLGLISKAVVL